MARPRKEGLDYFPLDVDFLQDRKIRALRGRYGHVGVMVYLYLLCDIYKNGYYVPFDDDLILCLSDDLGISEDCTRQIVSYLLSRSLLDDTLAKSVNVLSAKSIQLRYQEAKKGCKRDVVVEAEYWLLEKSETLGFIKVCPNLSFYEKNPRLPRKNPDNFEKKTTKESKAKESKVNECSAPFAHFQQIQVLYNSICKSLTLFGTYTLFTAKHLKTFHKISLVFRVRV